MPGLFRRLRAAQVRDGPADDLKAGRHFRAYFPAGKTQHVPATAGQFVIAPAVPGQRPGQDVVTLSVALDINLPRAAENSKVKAEKTGAGFNV